VQGKQRESETVNLLGTPGSLPRGVRRALRVKSARRWLTMTTLDPHSPEVSPLGRLSSVGVFCGSAEGVQPVYREAAELFGCLLARTGIEVVFGGGCVGLMGALADAALKAGGRAVGVIPQTLVDREIAHSGLTHLHVVGSMYERKALMARLSDAFVLLPGGYGSLDEFSEALTWVQLGMERKPCGVLNVNGYYDRLLEWFDEAAREGFVQPVFRSMILADPDPKRLLERLRTAPPIRQTRWVNDGKR
jgi:uncharacterized protein (TIGR00730 family)